jgi:hypothetical protein
MTYTQLEIDALIDEIWLEESLSRDRRLQLQGAEMLRDALLYGLYFHVDLERLPKAHVFQREVNVCPTGHCEKSGEGEDTSFAMWSEYGYKHCPDCGALLADGD